MSTSDRFSRIGCDYILVNQQVGVRYIIDPRPRSKTGQAEWHGSPEDSCKARGNRSGKSPEVVITWKP